MRLASWECVQQRLPSLLDPPITFAHRGAKAYAPENTIEAFALALKLGASGLESDVWVTADGVAVLDHDGVIRVGRFKKRPIGELRRDELPEHIPTLTELFDACGTDFHLSLDLKGPDTGAARSSPTPPNPKSSAPSANTLPSCSHVSGCVITNSTCWPACATWTTR